MGETLRACRKCLLHADSEEEFFQKMDEYIANLDPDVRADQKLYEERLMICRDCSNMLNGMCRLCGCFVELRAAIRVRKCPDVKRRW